VLEAVAPLEVRANAGARARTRAQQGGAYAPP
jgi:hypothetical protein